MQLGDRKISLLAFDLDGTLLNDSFDVSGETLQAIHNVMNMGVKATISSGRIPSMQQVFVSLLGFKGPYIASNGALVIDSYNDAVLHSQPINADVLKHLCDYCLDLQMHVAVHTMKALYFSRDNPRVARLEYYHRVAAKHDFPRIPLELLEKGCDNYLEVPAYKVLVFTPEETQYQLLANYLDEVPELIYTFSEANLFEISPRGVDKGKGIELVAAHYGIPLSEVCAFGDYDNDIPIFQRVGTAIAMGNASDNLKAVADFVTDTNSNNGIGKALSAIVDAKAKSNHQT